VLSEDIDSLGNNNSNDECDSSDDFWEFYDLVQALFCTAVLLSVCTLQPKTKGWPTGFG